MATALPYTQLIQDYSEILFFTKETEKTMFGTCPYTGRNKRVSKKYCSPYQRVLNLEPLTADNIKKGLEVVLISDFPVLMKVFSSPDGYTVGEYYGDAILSSFKDYAVVIEPAEEVTPKETATEQLPAPPAFEENTKATPAPSLSSVEATLEDLERLQRMLKATIKAHKDFIKKSKKLRDASLQDTSPKRMSYMSHGLNHDGWRKMVNLCEISYFVRTAPWYTEVEAREDVQITQNYCVSFDVRNLRKNHSK